MGRSVAYELLRPVDLYAFWFARTIAFKTSDTLLRALPLFVVAVWVLPWLGLEEWALSFPTVVSGLWFAVSMIATVLLSCAIIMLYQIALFWLISGRGLQALMLGSMNVFSGMIVPLPLYPDWFQGFLEWQPFRGLADVPFRIYSGDIPPDAAFGEVTFQFGWVVVLVVFGYGLLRRAQSKLVVQGG